MKLSKKQALDLIKVLSYVNVRGIHTGVDVAGMCEELESFVLYDESDAAPCDCGPNEECPQCPMDDGVSVQDQVMRCLVQALEKMKEVSDEKDEEDEETGEGDPEEEDAEEPDEQEDEEGDEADDEGEEADGEGDRADDEGDDTGSGEADEEDEDEEGLNDSVSPWAFHKLPSVKAEVIESTVGETGDQVTLEFEADRIKKRRPHESTKFVCDVLVDAEAAILDITHVQRVAKKQLHITNRDGELHTFCVSRFPKAWSEIMPMGVLVRIK